MPDQLRIEYLPLSELQAAPRNPKGHDEQGIAASINRHGFVEAVIIDGRTGRLVGGHGRVDDLAARKARGDHPPARVTVSEDGEWLVPTSLGWASDSDEDAEHLLLALNQLPQAGGWQPQGLIEILDDLHTSSVGLDGTGFTAEYLDDLMAQVAEGGGTGADPWKDRRKAELPNPGSFTGGQVWRVGPHTLVVGDARDPACWEWLPPAALMVTDPPYGIAYGGGGGLEREAIEGDGDPDQAAALLDAVLDRHVAHSLGGCPSYVFLSASDAYPTVCAPLVRRGMYRWQIVWVKDRATFGRADFNFRHEPIVYGWLPGPRLHPFTDHTATSVLEFPTPRASEHHPTAKPVALLQHLIGLSSDEGDVVLDPFAGSGSALVAAARSNRIGAGIELVPSYARVAVDRLAEATGQTPELVAGEST
jgi:hypothetical protein